MTEETLLRILARLEAIETLQANAICGGYLDTNTSAFAAEEAHKKIVAKFEARSIPALPPVLADHYADEVAHHIGRILAHALEQLKAARPL